jgi:hypothetical protein
VHLHSCSQLDTHVVVLLLCHLQQIVQNSVHMWSPLPTYGMSRYQSPAPLILPLQVCLLLCASTSCHGL